MPEQKVAPDSSWTSPITADLVASATIAPGQIALDGEDIYWSEERMTDLDGRKLFPPPSVETVPYELTGIEFELYNKVSRKRRPRNRRNAASRRPRR